MNEEFEKQLAEKFPFMKKRNPSEDSSPYAAFGCEMDDGWYSLLVGLCEEITDAYGKAGVPVNLKPEQIKEKYGTLRFYYSFESFDISSELKKEIADIVSKWEHKSAAVCEECGAEGKYRGDLSYVLTLCDTCYRKHKKDK